jgi:hypothetical protein
VSAGRLWRHKRGGRSAPLRESNTPDSPGSHNASAEVALCRVRRQPAAAAAAAAAAFTRTPASRRGSQGRRPTFVAGGPANEPAPPLNPLYSPVRIGPCVLIGAPPLLPRKARTLKRCPPPSPRLLWRPVHFFCPPPPQKQEAAGPPTAPTCPQTLRHYIDAPAAQVPRTCMGTRWLDPAHGYCFRVPEPSPLCAKRTLPAGPKATCAHSPAWPGTLG